MKQGILWFDNSNTDLAEKIDHAVEYVQKKYRKAPRFCYVHPSMLENETGFGRDGLSVRSSSSVMPNHFWLELQFE